MTTAPEDLDALLAAPSPLVEALSDPGYYRSAVPLIEAEARAYLSALPDGHTYLSTMQLVTGIWPEWRQHPKLSPKLFALLNKLRMKGLADCVTLGTPTVQFGKSVVPSLWHKPLGLRVAKVSAIQRYSTTASMARAASAMLLVSDIAQVVLPGEEGFRMSFDEQLGLLRQLVEDARQVLA